MSPFRSKPLDAAQKIRLLSIAVQLNVSKLTRSEIAVLTQLAQHQNPITGLCNPSHGRLCRVLGLGRRTVQEAIASLSALNLIQVHRTPGRSNSYNLASPDLLQKFGPKAVAKTTLSEHQIEQRSAREGAAQCTTHAQPTAPEKEKQKVKEKWDERRKLQNAENELVEALARKGIGYEEVLGLSSKELQETVMCIASKRITLKQSVKQIAARLLDRQSRNVALD